MQLPVKFGSKEAIWCDFKASAMAVEVSVVMPVRNGEAFVELAVRSILSQTFQALELIIIDDGSFDSTPSILSSLAATDSRIRLLSSGGRGIVDALNLGIVQSGSDLIARMDADDMALPERLERQIQFMRSNPDVVASGSSVLLIDGTGIETGTRDVAVDRAAIADELQRTNAFIHPTMIIQKQALLDAGLYRHACTYAEDYDLWLRLEEIGELANLAEPTLKYRMHAGQISNIKRVQQRAAAALARQVAWRRRSGKGEGVDMKQPVHVACGELLRLRADEVPQLTALEGPDLSIMLRLAKPLMTRKAVSSYVHRLGTEANFGKMWSLRINLALSGFRDRFTGPFYGQFGSR